MVTEAPTPLIDVSNGGTFYLMRLFHMKLKTATSFDEQIDKLKDKNIVIENPATCMDFLTKVNYYRLSGYYLPYICKDTGKCFFPTSFERIRQIYNFDTELRNLIALVIEKIEVHLRTQFSYYHGHKYGPDGYMNSSSFNNRHNHPIFIKHVNDCIYENSNTLVVKHHIKNYDGKFPIWVVSEFFSMEMLSYFYRGMKNNDKAHLAKTLYGTNYQTLDSWLRCLTDLRNRCAHYSRLYYWIFPAIPKMPEHIHYTPTRRLFAQVYMLKMMYPTPDDWNKDFVKPLVKIIKKYKTFISLKHLDFPYRWKSMLLNK